jgi:uncharacterized repeat protein (TIGR03803 family)
MKNQLTILDDGITKQTTERKGQNMRNMEMTNAMRMKLFCLATFEMAMTAAHLTAQVFTTLHSFTGGSDGANPYGGLILSGNTLYGTAYAGGSSGNGTVFAVNTDATGFTNLHNFTGRGGANPYAGLVLSGHTLYGTTYSGGTGGSGTVFSLSFRPQLTIPPSETNLILTWPTNYGGFDYTGYTLQSTTNLGSSAVWNTDAPAPVVVNGQNVVTNSITGSHQFYRLSQ